MSNSTGTELASIRGVVDSEGRLIEADPPLAALHRRAGGKEAGPLAIPQVAGIARLSRKLGIVVSRGAIAADDENDLELWVRAEPSGDKVLLSIDSWTERPRHIPAGTRDIERESDFVRAAADWVWEADEHLAITLMSPTAANALGKPPVELLGQHLTSLFRFCEREDGSFPLLSALAERSRFEDQLAELRIGNRQKYRLDGVPLIDGAGKFAGFRGSATSVVAASDSDTVNSGMGDGSGLPATAAEPFAAAMSSVFNERLGKALRDPLSHIIKHAETIGTQSDGPLKSAYADYAADIASAGKHLLSLVDDIVDLQTIERPDFAPAKEEIDLSAVARQAANMLAMASNKRGVRIRYPRDTLQLPAIGEYRRALQIVVNLVGNAIRYTPEGSMVSILAGRKGNFAALMVTDEGKGIDPADQERIFDKFERIDASEPEGSGLGLYIARRLARAMGGDVICDSKPGEGAKFILTLPER